MSESTEKSRSSSCLNKEGTLFPILENLNGAIQKSLCKASFQWCAVLYLLTPLLIAVLFLLSLFQMGQRTVSVCSGALSERCVFFGNLESCFHRNFKSYFHSPALQKCITDYYRCL